MKRIIFLLLFLTHFGGVAQSNQVRVDSLKDELLIAKLDTTKVLILLGIGRSFNGINADSMLHYKVEALQLSKEINFQTARTNSEVGYTYRGIGDYPKAFEYLFEGLKIATKEKDYNGIGYAENGMAVIYLHLEDNSNAIIHEKRAIKAYEMAGNHDLATESMVPLGRAFRRNMQLDSASFYFQKAYDILDGFRNRGTYSLLLLEMGHLEFLLNNHSKAFEYLRESIQNSEMFNHAFMNSLAHNTSAGLFKTMNKVDSSIYHAERSYIIAEKVPSKVLLLESSILLAELYEKTDTEKVNFYLKKVNELNTELYGVEKVQELQKTLSEEQARQRKQEEVQLAYQNQLKQYGFLAGLVFLMLVAFLLYRNNQRKQKDNLILQSQKEEIESTLSQLKSTQAQLIQSEKMASLGELTAGIAHEIQNPLNFVNNFSEVSEELIQEIKDERHKTQDERDESLEDEILTDIEQNLEKINHHGNRASSIVKGMLEHSRTSTGERELTDINALADEYLRLSYHGLRAKDKTFNADFKTNFDKSLPKIEVVSQDIGRVLLNLINNAFQASSEEALRRKSYSDENEAKSGRYKPTVTVTTKSENDVVIIAVKDNGSGIPDKIKDKIFQPFFTTKDTGKGTGLGLSLAYDIVKAHGGELTVESLPANRVGLPASRVGKTVFSIHLPIKKS